MRCVACVGDAGTVTVVLRDRFSGDGFSECAAENGFWTPDAWCGGGVLTARTCAGAAAQCCTQQTDAVSAGKHRAASLLSVHSRYRWNHCVHASDVHTGAALLLRQRVACWVLPMAGLAWQDWIYGVTNRQDPAFTCTGWPVASWAVSGMLNALTPGAGSHAAPSGMPATWPRVWPISARACCDPVTLATTGLEPIRHSHDGIQGCNSGLELRLIADTQRTVRRLQMSVLSTP